MATYRRMTSERMMQVRAFAAALADGRSVADMAMGNRAPVAKPVAAPAVLTSTATGTVGGELAVRDRVTDQEVAARKDWMRAACEYAENYTGDFSFMIDMRTAMKRNGGLSIPQMRGTLNCMRAEAQRIIENAKRATAAAEAAAAKPTTEATTFAYNEILDGYYTVKFKFEDGSHVTIRVNSLSPKQSRDGKRHQFASYLCGPINTSDYRRFAEIKGATFRAFSLYGQNYARQIAALKILMGTNDQTQYGKAYAKMATRCYRCGKLLTEPTSIEDGIGPICAGRE